MMDPSELCLLTQEVSNMREVVTLLKPFEEVTRELSLSLFRRQSLLLEDCNVLLWIVDQLIH